MADLHDGADLGCSAWANYYIGRKQQMLRFIMPVLVQRIVIKQYIITSCNAFEAINKFPGEFSFFNIRFHTWRRRYGILYGRYFGPMTSISGSDCLNTDFLSPYRLSNESI